MSSLQHEVLPASDVPAAGDAPTAQAWPEPSQLNTFEHMHLGRVAGEQRWAELGLTLLYSPGLKGVDLYLDVESQLDSYFELIYSTQIFSVSEHSACLLCLM